MDLLDDVVDKSWGIGKSMDVVELGILMTCGTLEDVGESVVICAVVSS